MKTKIFSFLATVGVVRGILIAIFSGIFLAWIVFVFSMDILIISDRLTLFVVSFTVLIFGVLSKIATDLLSWIPEVLVINKKFQKVVDFVIALGLTGMAILIFLVYYQDRPTFGTIIFGLAELVIIYLLYKNGSKAYDTFFVIMIITFIVFISHGLISEYYFDQTENWNGQIMLAGFYLALIVMTRIPERFYKSKIQPRIEKRRVEKAEKTNQKKADKDRRNKIDSLMWLSLLDLGRSYIDFAAYEIGDYEKKQTEFYLEVFFSGIERGKKMNAEELKSICHKISRVKHKLDQNFLNAVTEQCLLNNLTYLVFTTTNNSLAVNEWPILFKRSNQKAALVAHYLTSAEEDGLYDFLFDSSTQIFNLGAFTGLVNCLGHCYKKSDDDLKSMAQQEMKRVLRFAKDYYEKIHFMEPTKEKLRKRIAEVETAYWECAI